MATMVVVLSIVKAMGADYPPAQLVFVRAMFGLLAVLPIVLPIVLRRRLADLAPKRPWLNLSRIVLSVAALTSTYASVTMLPLPLVTTINFLRPFALIALAALILKEAIDGRTIACAALGLLGVGVAVGPGSDGDALGVGVALGAVLFGTLAVVTMRLLADEPISLLMVYYAVGLVILSAVPAFFTWRPIAAEHWLWLLAIGGLAQTGQYCFLLAHRLARASVLAIVSYAQLIMSTAAGIAFFSETPGLGVFLGAVIILAANLAALRRREETV